MDAERVETHAQHRLEIGPVLLAIEHRNAIQEVWPGQQTASVKPRSSAPGLIQGRKVQSAGRLERVDLSFQPEERSLALEQIEHRIKNGLRSSSRQAGAKGFPILLLPRDLVGFGDRKSTRLNSSHSQISYAVFCLK